MQWWLTMCSSHTNSSGTFDCQCAHSMDAHIPGIGVWGGSIYRVYTRYIDIPGIYQVYTLLSIWAGPPPWPPPQPLAHPPTPSTHKPWLMHKHVRSVLVDHALQPTHGLFIGRLWQQAFYNTGTLWYLVTLVLESRYNFLETVQSRVIL